jgi:hypothetical protein
MTWHAIKPAVGWGTETAPMACLTVFREMGAFRSLAIALI